MCMRRVVMMVVALVVAGTLCVTNSRRGEYVEWAIKKSHPDSGHLLSRVIRPETAPMYMDGATVWHNFGLFHCFAQRLGTGIS